MKKTKVRFPAVAEAFYPSDTHELETLLTEMLQKVEERIGNKALKALIVPHAAYNYSGLVAAHAFKTVVGRSCRTVILMGNAHSYLFDGIAIDPHEAWRSPIGTVPVNTALSRQLITLDPGLFHEIDIAHHCDHILEVQLPLLQHTLTPGFSILPMLFGENSQDIYHKTADYLLSVLTPDDLLVVSTDLSHYTPYHDAVTIDRTTMDYMVKMDIEGLERHDMALRQRVIPEATSAFCSPDALKTLFEIGRRLGWSAEELAYRNSGDVLHDDRNAVVGYGSIAFFEP
jgi:hypothetical protein